ncbi:MmgE/PrpD family protein [Paraburkholderia phosphatilytica]|uniref:MmgE/PrpD family protein n=1 Tax=Paraburkholderia phosphatilytica TaxID=2282883 RepID=UPI000E4E43CF|nr:MmgE/PrpD family protein [Paraburkholderia phosphatilytica]
MHEAAAHSVVSDALVTFAVAPLPQSAASSVDAARRAVADARATASQSRDAARRVAELLKSQQGSPADARVQAWTLGALLAGEAASSAPSFATPVLAAAITMGDRIAASDDDIAAAVAIGHEAAARVLSALDSSEYRARWNVASSLGVLGATLAVARLLKLDATRARHALGVAATQAAGLAHNAGHAMEAIETGKAAADAIESTLIAKHGFTSAPASIDGRRGLAALMAYRFDADAITNELGVRWTS